VYVDSHSNFTVIGTSDYVIQTGHNFTIECHGTYPPILKVVRRNKVQVSKSFYTTIMWFWAFYTAIMWFWAFYTVIMGFWAFCTAIMGFWAFCTAIMGFWAFYTAIMGFWAFYTAIMGFWVLIKGSYKLQFYLVVGVIKPFWSLIHVEGW
jgi:hypothetical protein